MHLVVMHLRVENLTLSSSKKIYLTYFYLDPCCLFEKSSKKLKLGELSKCIFMDSLSAC